MLTKALFMSMTCVMLANGTACAQTCARDRPLDVKLFVTAECLQCDEARRFLYSQGIPFREFDARYPEIARRLLDGPAQGAVPAIYICGEWFVGFGAITKHQILNLFPQPT